MSQAQSKSSEISGYIFAPEYKNKIKGMITLSTTSQPPMATPCDELPKLKLTLPQNDVLQHPFGNTLQIYAFHGCPVDCGPNWSKEQIEQAVQDSPNKSAKDPLAAKCCRNKVLKKVDEGFCRIVNWDNLKNNIPPTLKISPIAAIPHKSRTYCMILNLKYKLKIKGKQGQFQSVNESTDKDLALQHSMYELGNVIPQIIWTLATAPDEDVPFLMSKVDLKDGFW